MTYFLHENTLIFHIQHVCLYVYVIYYIQYSEPASSTRPQLAGGTDLLRFSASSLKSVTLQCPAQGFPVPLYRYIKNRVSQFNTRLSTLIRDNFVPHFRFLLAKKNFHRVRICLFYVNLHCLIMSRCV